MWRTNKKANKAGKKTFNNYGEIWDNWTYA